MRTLPPTLQDVAGGDGHVGDARGLVGREPGRSTPPATSMPPATVPLPPSVPPATSIGLACEPTTDSLPALTVLLPCQVSAPVRNSVPSPLLVRLPV